MLSVRMSFFYGGVEERYRQLKRKWVGREVVKESRSGLGVVLTTQLRIFIFFFIHIFFPLPVYNLETKLQNNWTLTTAIQLYPKK